MIDTILKQIHQRAIASKDDVVILKVSADHVYACHDIHAIHPVKPKKLKQSKKGKYFVLSGKRFYLDDFAWKEVV